MTAVQPVSADHDHITGAPIEFDHVSKRYRGQRLAAVADLTLSIPAGETVMFIGPSGCGKTTSLKMINRLHEPTSGTITVAGKDVRKQNENELRRHIGYVIQGGSLLPHLTVRENIALVPRLLRWDANRIERRVDELLDMVSLEPAMYRDRYPRELSGGQQQRVGVARGLAADPPVILMDEPFGAVDPITRSRLQDELMAIQAELRKTIVCVTHDIDEAIKLGDRILILQEGAKIAQYDTPANILAAPANDFVADFVGAGASLKQLSLSRVAELDLIDVPRAVVGEDVKAVRARLRSNPRLNRDDVVIVDQRRRPLAWLSSLDLPAAGAVRGLRDDSLATVDEHATLNDALDQMLATSFNGVVVTGRRGEYRGVLDFDSVTDHVRTMHEQALAARVEDLDDLDDEEDAAKTLRLKPVRDAGGSHG